MMVDVVDVVDVAEGRRRWALYVYIHAPAYKVRCVVCRVQNAQYVHIRLHLLHEINMFDACTMRGGGVASKKMFCIL